MHLVTLAEPVNLGKTLGILERGSWLMHDLNAFEIAQRAQRGTVKVDAWKEPIRRGVEGIVMRSGAIGDLLLLTPALRVFSVSLGATPIISCFPHHHSLFAENTDVVTTDYPINLDRIGDLGIISLENTMECDHAQHATDVFAKALGLQAPLADYRPVYHVTDAEKEAAQKHIFKGRPTLAVHPLASVANRSYPLSQWSEVIARLERQGWGIVILGRKGELPPIPPPAQNVFVRDLSQLGLSFRESAAVLSQCSAFVGVDSGWAHMCHALDIPAVVLFAAFNWQTRTSKAPKTIALTGVGECAPCNWHMHAGQQFPPGKPCSRQGLCTVLAGISPERITAKVGLLKP